MARDKNGYTENFELESELFPAFRKAVSAARELGLEDRPEHFRRVSGTGVGTARGTPVERPSEISADIYKDDPAYGSPEPLSQGVLPEADAELPPEEKKPDPPQKEEKIPALFGDACLDKYKKREEPADEPTLLEFLNQPLEEDPPVPVPSLFEGIGRQYFASDEVLRLAAEAEAEEQAAEAEREAQDEEPEDALPEQEEPAPDAEELFGMISSIYHQQREDWDRHMYEKGMNERRINDPYNTAFNNRQPAANYDNVDEMPMERKYTLTTVEGSVGTDTGKKRAKRTGGRRHFRINRGE